MDFVPLVALAGLVFAFNNFLKFLSGKDFKSAVTQLIVWASGVAGIFIAAQTDFAGGIRIGDEALSTLNGWSLLFVGLTFASVASTLNEVKKALDSSDTAKTPPMIP